MYQWWRAWREKNRTRRFQSTVVLCFERKSHFIIVVITNFFKMESHTFTAAVRGYHYYRRFWRAKENEKLICLYEAGKPFDRFAIKTVNESGEIVDIYRKKFQE